MYEKAELESRRKTNENRQRNLILIEEVKVLRSDIRKSDKTTANFH
jgi:hypothetical protein